MYWIAYWKVSSHGYLKDESAQMSLHSWFEKIWWQTSSPPFWLRCIESIYSKASQIHLNQRAAKSITPSLPLISVGNITAGGSGKTPFVLWLADQLKDQGYKPVILCRGDGGSNTSPHLITQADTATNIGDEAKMLANASHSPVIAAADRLAGSRMAQGLGNIIILDDGFQYRHLQRNCDIVLIPQEGVGNGHQIPAGPLREPITSLHRADIIVRTGSTANDVSSQAFSAKQEYLWQTKPMQLIDIMNTDTPIPDAAFAVCAIARPQRFFDDLTAIVDFDLSGGKAFADHYSFHHNDVKEILNLHHHIVVTSKDAVKLQPLWPVDRPLWVLRQQGIAKPALLSAIQTFLPAI